MLQPFDFLSWAVRRPPPVLSSLSRTHIGNIRQVNEDRVLDRSDRALWAVADGMGGHRGGDIAAELAIAGLRGLADSDQPIDERAILSALEQANADIHRHGQTVGGVIGSTIVALHVEQGRAHLFWAGDSRAYLVRQARCRQMTNDHSLVQELIDAGAIAREHAVHHPQAHVITRALGIEPGITIETASYPVRAGDVLLLCSDGLTRGFDPCLDEQLPNSDAAIADRMIDKALQLDGSDNISLVFVRIGGLRAG